MTPKTLEPRFGSRNIIKKVCVYFFYYCPGNLRLLRCLLRFTFIYFSPHSSPASCDFLSSSAPWLSASLASLLILMSPFHISFMHSEGEKKQNTQGGLSYILCYLQREELVHLCYVQ